jgi:hypothetical protein
MIDLKIDFKILSLKPFFSLRTERRVETFEPDGGSVQGRVFQVERSSSGAGQRSHRQRKDQLRT